jgi:hypothetical protein
MTTVLPIHPTWILLLCVGVAACASPQKKFDVMDMYNVPHAAPATAPAVTVDYDNYYTQPTGYRGCAVINDAPSCGGG